jgi:GT2 family glycosyltransferase
MSQSIAAVVLNFRTPALSIRAVESLRRSSRPLQHIVVVDNGSGDGSSEILQRELAGTTIIALTGNLGFSGGVNVGIRTALQRGARSVLLVNSDAILHEDALAHLEQALAETRAGVAGPVLLSLSEPAIVESLGIDYSNVTGRMVHRGFGREHRPGAVLASREVDGVSGCIMLINREVFDAIGLFGEEYFFSFEDLDFCLRAAEKGFATVCVGGALAFHEASSSIGRASDARLYFATRNHLLLAERRGAGSLPARLLQTASILVLNFAAAIVLFRPGFVRRIVAVVEGARDHFAGRYGPRRQLRRRADGHVAC